MSTPDAYAVARILRRAGHFLAESLWEYWPCNGENNEIPERNVSLHFGAAFHQAGYRIYGEVHTKGSTSQRLDFLAVEPNQGVMVVAECKKLYSAEKCGELVEDAARLGNFIPLDDRPWQASFGVLAATTWDDPIAHWWSTMGAEPPGRGHRNWQELRSLLPKAHWGSVMLNAPDEGQRAAALRRHYLLYVVFDRPDPAPEAR